MSAIFDGYEKEFLELNSAITRKIALIPTLQRDEKKTKINETENDVAEAEALVRRMDLEARSLPAGVKTPLLNKLKDYKASLQKLKEGLKKSAVSLVDVGAARDELLNRAELGDTGSGAATSASQRDRLMSANDRAKQTAARIAEGKKTLLETEDVGVSILENLHKQRETIVRSGNTVRGDHMLLFSGPAVDKLQGVDENIGVARRYLGQMGKRAMQNKIMLGGVIVMLIIGIILIIYVKLH